MEFIIIRDESPTPSPVEPTPKPELGSVKSLNYSKSPTSVMSSQITDDEVSVYVTGHIITCLLGIILNEYDEQSTDLQSIILKPVVDRCHIYT